jgi:hypothetical protein
MADTKPSALDRWTKIAQIVSALSVIVGIVLAVTEIYKTSSEIRESAHVARLNELPSVKEMIKEDGEVRSNALKDFGGTWDKKKISQILAQHETASEAYYSEVWCRSKPWAITTKYLGRWWAQTLWTLDSSMRW